ncbi:MAG TPA: M15 family metallopeptidase [Euzebya sp.]|nr:M15 family metallopeptidase [Euzebya sp.]
MAAIAILPACAALGGARPVPVAPASVAPSTMPVPSDLTATDPPLAPVAPSAPPDGSGPGRASEAPSADPGSVQQSGTPSADPGSVAAGSPASASPLPAGVSRPDWLGTRPLPLGPDGEALSQPTPDELVVRRVPTIDLLPLPPVAAPYAATIQPLSDAVVARSTWTPECPVAREELRYLTVSFWGFDDRPHTGEIIVNASWAQEVADIFGQLFDVRYPIEEMRIVTAAELDGVPTGDGNDTTGFVCRPARGSASWSQHAFGLAIDINPFINPYQRGERILPELAGAYLDRDHDRPGMLVEGSTAVQAFDAIGWGWGGRWNSLIDWMHFSANGR